MSMQIDDAEIRDQLHTWIESAWVPQAIYDDIPLVPSTAADLPIAYVHLEKIEPEPNAETAAIGQVLLKCKYMLTLQDAWPTSSTIQALVIEKGQALLDLLTADLVFLNKWRRDVTSADFTQEAKTAADSEEPYYELSIEFTVKVEADR